MKVGLEMGFLQGGFALRGGFNRILGKHKWVEVRSRECLDRAGDIGIKTKVMYIKIKREMSNGVAVHRLSVRRLRGYNDLWFQRHLMKNISLKCVKINVTEK